MAADKTGAGLLLLRIAAGGTMLVAHGIPKLASFSQRMGSFPDPLGIGSPVSLSLAVFAEVVCAAAIVLGVGTRLAALPLIVTMLVAAFVVHGGDPWSKKEFALLYGACFATLALTGSGPLRLRLSALVKLDRWS